MLDAVVHYVVTLSYISRTVFLNRVLS